MAKALDISSKLKESVRPLLVALGVSLVVAAVQLGFPSPELAAYDARLRLENRIAPIPVRDDLVLLGISDESLLDHGRWPWPRRFWVGVIDALVEAKARGLFFDVTFPESTATRLDTETGRMTLAQAIDVAGAGARSAFSQELGRVVSQAHTVPASAVPELEHLFDESFGQTSGFLRSITASDDQLLGDALVLARADGLLTGGVMSLPVTAEPGRAAEVAAYRGALPWLLEHPGQPASGMPGADRPPLSALVPRLTETGALFAAYLADPSLTAASPGLDPALVPALAARGRAVRQELVDTLVARALTGSDPRGKTRDELLRAALPATWSARGGPAESQLDQALARTLRRDAYLRPAALPPGNALPVADSLSLPIFEISRGYTLMGGDWSLPDPDGSLRSVPLLHACGDAVIPTVGLSLYLALSSPAGGRAPELALEPDGHLRVTAGATTTRVPLLPGARALVHWPGPLQRFTLLSLSPLLSYAAARRDRRVALAKVQNQPATWALIDLVRACRVGGDDAPVSLGELVRRLPARFAQVTPDRWLVPHLPDTPTSVEDKRTPAAWQAFLTAYVDRIESAYLDTFIASMKKKLAEPGLPEAKATKYRALLADYELMGPGLAKARAELAARLAGKLCVIGDVATSSTDLAPMAFSTLYPKVGSHLSLLNTLSSGRVLARPWAWHFTDAARDGNPGVQLPLAFAACLITALAASHLTSRRGVIWSLAFIAAWCAGACALFLYAGLWVDVVAPVMGVVLTHATVFAHSYGRTENVRKMFESYVDPKIVHVLMEDETLWTELGGREQVITAFFSDIAGFTTLSELLGAKELSEMLTDYLSPMTDIILAHEGIRDKYIGDAIVAFFGAPIVAPGHELNACLSSIAQQEQLVLLKERWKREHCSWYEKVLGAGMDLEFRIGLNTGRAKVGNFGSHSSKNYTMIGDTVNLAARLEGANKEYGSNIMCALPTVEACGDKIVTRELDRLVVKGKLEAARVFEVIGRTGAVPAFWSELLDAYRQALVHYHAREFEKARALFEQCVKIRPNDGPSQVYIERATEFIAHPPPANWNGTFVMTHK